MAASQYATEDRVHAATVGSSHVCAPISLSARWLAYAPLDEPDGCCYPLPPASAAASAGSAVADLAALSTRSVYSLVGQLRDAVGWAGVDGGGGGAQTQGGSSKAGSAPPTDRAASVVAICDLDSRRTVVSFVAHNHAISAISLDHSGTTVATASVEGHAINIFAVCLPLSTRSIAAVPSTRVLPTTAGVVPEYQGVRHSAPIGSLPSALWPLTVAGTPSTVGADQRRGRASRAACSRRRSRAARRSSSLQARTPQIATVPTVLNRLRTFDGYGHCATSTYVPRPLDRLGSPPHCVSIARMRHCARHGTAAFRSTDAATVGL